ncbi:MULTISPECIES: histidine kinase [unclassified Streptomyces]|uniref:sensor histidine kinase n=1 Tax=unclassified Streptomyces TaxID=2593676 RepID=UPI0033B55581
MAEGMTGRTGRWRLAGGPWVRPAARSDTAKVELYTRYTFQAMAGLEVGGLAFPLLLGERSPSDIWLFLLLLGHSAMCAVVSTRALDWRLGRRERSGALLAASAALTGVCLVVLILLLDSGALSRDGDFALLLMGITAFGLGTLALGLRTTRERVLSVIAAATATAATTALLGLGWRQAWLDFVGVACAGALFVVTYVFSAWLAGVVKALDAARELQTRVAVAEERLRFGRDIHDVMGRNLAVMALKSELAVQLAERGRPEALSQMAEVQRIAQESQREIRDVVRGYRQASLRTELEGALSVLRAAGIEGVVHGLDDGPALPPDLQSALGWVVREATTNVLRHGDPRGCTIRLSTGERAGGKQERGDARQEEVVLMVQNDGVPEPAGPPDGGAGAGGGLRQTPGTGLTGLRERLAAHDGTLEAGPVGGTGCFRLTVRVPLPAPADGTYDGPGTAGGEAAA